MLRGTAHKLLFSTEMKYQRAEVKENLYRRVSGRHGTVVEVVCGYGEVRTTGKSVM